MRARNELYNLDISFLRSIAEGINLSFRYYGDKSKEDLLNIINRKLDTENRDVIFKMYLTCYEADKIIYKIKPKGMSEIVGAIEKFFKKEEYLYEVTVGARRCDVVFFSDNDIIAIEIKSSLDNVIGALDQLNYYKKWADKIYLAYDIKHIKTIEKLSIEDFGIGLLEYSNGEIKLINKPHFQNHNSIYRLSFMTYNYLRNIAKKHQVDLDDGKQAISMRLKEKISDNEAKKIFQTFLKERTLI